MTVVQAGTVGTFFTVSINDTLANRDVPVNHKVTASLNVVYVFDICDLITVIQPFTDLRVTPILQH